ncbi:hypothetical protein [Tengunoibacter tsumagoiensis]|uniref:Uncharacterized protein n=1 Tax=Tengunoibacter tsumagoiensis TaxID=2014871 RepID=A0A402A8V2_9CHLR|nr:hypothetical protein [Tengunoibacter tsumagoiensis]GCE15573.1 hypothetical protein KTT_54320 [Tengunoibacter tsumagoiensis]
MSTHEGSARPLQQTRLLAKRKAIFFLTIVSFLNTMGLIAKASIGTNIDIVRYSWYASLEALAYWSPHCYARAKMKKIEKNHEHKYITYYHQRTRSASLERDHPTGTG